MAQDTLAILVILVLAHAPLLYGAVFSRREAPMRRLLAWTHAVARLLEQIKRR